MTISLLRDVPITTGRDSTVKSGLTTKTYWPVCPVWTAREGTTTVLGCVLNVRTTLTNCPGQRCFSRLAKVPFNRMVPVVLSTVLSIKVRTPWTAFVSSLGGVAATASLPAAICFLISDKYCSGTEKVAYMGWIWLIITRGGLSLALTILPW